MYKNFPKCIKVDSKPHKFCPGCGHGITLKEIGFAIDELKIQNETMLGIDIGCSLLAWDFFNVATVQTHHGRTIPVVKGYKTQKPEKICISYIGDGGGYAIGLGALVTSANRNDPITVILVNNTLYGMTGGQMAPTTIIGEKTTTTQGGKKTDSGNLMHGPELINCLANKRAFIARASVANPLVLRDTIKKALMHQKNSHSFSFVEVLSMCPVNWKLDSKDSLKYLKKMEGIYKTGIIYGK